jgi:hypothetical protein
MHTTCSAMHPVTRTQVPHGLPLSPTLPEPFVLIVLDDELDYLGYSCSFHSVLFVYTNFTVMCSLSDTWFAFLRLLVA